MIGDLTGITRGKISPTNKFIAEKGMRLPESVLLQTVTGDYVEDDIYYELLDPADIDMICRPDQNAVFLVPWAIEPDRRRKVHLQVRAWSSAIAR